MRTRTLAALVAVATLSLGGPALAAEDADASPLSSKTFEGLKLRNIGPAFMSGRIADIAIHPEDPSIWYVAVGSGGVWKTANAGTTWTPVFDEEASYSIGCVTIDPSNPHVVWVGTGEDVGGRHVGFGDGVYRSRDGGAHWENLGLKDSQHITKIIVHPEDSDVVWVASQGPLWTKGGERGVYKTTDGGGSWKKVLGGGEWTGASALVIDPRDPDVLYAATWQHQRTVAAYMGGGPESGLHRTTDGGETWERLTEGLPEGNMAKIGLAISPQNPDVLYASIALNRREGGVYRSTDRGSSWEKRSDAVSGATGPHYYQELYASPHAFDRIYLVDMRVQISDDGGKTFRRMKEAHKHSDNHSIAFRADDPDYLLVGTDGGIYESLDLAENWRFIANLPVTQFYKVAVDDAEPFYTVYGGTQDNSTQGGPSRTDTVNGIRNADWFLTLFADGHQPATEPGNPDIMYSEWQQGNITRVDRTTGEIVHIQPQPEPGDPPERFNWDAPILVSPHLPTRLYYASQRVWRSDDRGDSWRPVSGDLTRNQDRMLLPLMERQWSWDSPWDLLAMSAYNTITSLAESPKEEGLLYAGTDDGLIQVSENGGETWRKVEVGSLPGVPSTAFVNDIKADLHDADTVYVALDNHKFGDFAPYLLKSTDRGLTWRSIAGDLPERHIVWRMVQDHVKPDLLFTGTEFGIFFTVDGGGKWVKLAGDVPTIPFRDLAIQRRENDLVGASFGRGFFILDDYAPLRDITEADLQEEALLLPVRRAWWYIERHPLGEGGRASQGAAYYIAPNPPFGATFTYYLEKDLKSRETRRQDEEKPLIEAGEDTPYPGWEEVEAERREPKPRVELTVRDDDGNVIRRLDAPAKAGVHRVAWDLRFPDTAAIDPGATPDPDDEEESLGGVLAAPGTYSVTLVKIVEGETTGLAGPVSFEVERMRTGALEGASPEETVAFWQRLAAAQRSASAAMTAVGKTFAHLKTLRVALDRSRSAPDGLDSELHAIEQELYAIEEGLSGNKSRAIVGEPDVHAVSRRLETVSAGTQLSTYGPTPTHRRSLEIAEEDLGGLRQRLNALLEKRIPALERELEQAGAPWTPGQPVPPVH
ncbi:MAG: glycosyl hydrolase [Acidobacteria bacterium]|jgi:photosystem II stability/assembly factor-like uncharacterized protein|nr:glycosyl hydrolase [Acidobacteriota bacterium]